MFVNKKNDKHQQDQRAFNLIAAGTDIDGNIVTTGDLRIDGRIAGDVSCTAKLIIGENGMVIGNIHCKSGEVSGAVEGRIIAVENLQLNPTASVKGDIESVHFIVERGAAITGHCTTSGNVGETDRLPRVKLIEYEEIQALPE